MAERWAVAMRPWCAQLRSHTKMAFEYDLESAGADIDTNTWVLKISIAFVSADAMLTCREALELLAVIARVDKRGWYELLRDYCDCSGNTSVSTTGAHVESIALARSPPRVCFVVLPHSPQSERVHDTVTYQYLLLPQAALSAEFRHALQRLQSLMTPMMRTAFAESRDAKWCTTLRFTPPAAYTMDATAYLRSVLLVVRALGMHTARIDLLAASSSNAPSRTASPAAERDPLAVDFMFALTRAEVDLARMHVSAAAVHVVRELTALGVQFASHEVLLDSESSAAPLACVGPIFLETTGARAREFDQSASPAALATQRVFTAHTRALTVGWKRLRPGAMAEERAPRFQALCSALETAQSVRSLGVTNCFAGLAAHPRAVKWRWFTYALFSKATQSSVEALMLKDQHCGAVDIDVIMSVLAAKFPASHLMDVQSVIDCFDYGGRDDQHWVWHEAARRLGLPGRSNARASAARSVQRTRTRIGTTGATTAQGVLRRGVYVDALDRFRAVLGAAGTSNAQGGSGTPTDPWLEIQRDNDTWLTRRVATIRGELQQQSEAPLPTMPPLAAAMQQQRGQQRHRLNGQPLGQGRQLPGRGGPLRTDVQAGQRIVANRGTADVDLGAVLLKGGTVVFVNPFDDAATPPETLEIRREALFPIIRDDARCQWIDIVVPGYGYCVVPRTRVSHVELSVDDDDDDGINDSAVSSLAHGYHGAIKSLTLSFETLDSTPNLLLPLLEYLGPQLEALALDLPMADDPAELARILDTCPRLRTLSLSLCGTTASRMLPMLAQAFDSGRCRVETLHVLQCPSDEHTLTFLERLQDPSSSAAQTLRHLSLRCARAPHTLSDSVLAAVSLTLQVSKTLEVVELSVSSALSRTLWLALARTDGEPLLVAKAPLPLAARVAFLSVLAHLRALPDEEEPPHKRQCVGASGSINDTNDTTKRLVRGCGVDLDTYVTALIFAFAAEPKERVVRLHVDEHDAREVAELYVEDFMNRYGDVESESGDDYDDYRSGTDDDGEGAETDEF